MLTLLGPLAPDVKAWLLEGAFTGRMAYEVKGPNLKGEYMMKLTVPDDEAYMKFEDEAALIRGMNVLRAAGGEQLLEMVPEPDGNAGDTDYSDVAIDPGLRPDGGAVDGTDDWPTENETLAGTDGNATPDPDVEKPVCEEGYHAVWLPKYNQWVCTTGGSWGGL